MREKGDWSRLGEASDSRECFSSLLENIRKMCTTPMFLVGDDEDGTSKIYKPDCHVL